METVTPFWRNEGYKIIKDKDLIPDCTYEERRQVAEVIGQLLTKSWELAGEKTKALSMAEEMKLFLGEISRRIQAGEYIYED